MQITIDVPDQYLLHDTPDAVASRFKLFTALMMFQAGQVSAGAACELAGVDRYTFLAACKEHGIPTVRYSPDDLEAECTWLSGDGSTSS